MNKLTIKALFLTAGVASLLQTADAAPLVYNAGDLFLGFRSSSSTTDYLIDIGQASIYRDAPLGTAFTLSIGNIGADDTELVRAVFGERVSGEVEARVQRRRRHRANVESLRARDGRVGQERDVLQRVELAHAVVDDRAHTARAGARDEE